MTAHGDRIVVYKPDHIGDVILTTPMFRHLRAHLGDEAEIIAVVGPWSAAVLRGNPFVQSTLPFASRSMSRGGPLTEADRAQNARTLHTVANKRPTWTINVRDDYQHVLHAYAMSAGRGRLVSHVAHHNWDHLVSDPVEYDPRLHEAIRHVGLLRPLGISVRPADVHLEVFPSEEDFAFADTVLSAVSLDRTICVFCGGGHHLNYWPVDRYIAIAKRMVEAGWRPMFVGGMNEFELLAPYQKRLDDIGAANLCGRTTLLQLAAVFRRVPRVVTNDGGPMHLAVASGATVIALFGSSPNSFYPLGEAHLVIDHNMWCRPCPHFTYEPRIQCADNICLQSISVDEVWYAIATKWMGSPGVTTPGGGMARGGIGLSR